MGKGKRMDVTQGFKLSSRSALKAMVAGVPLALASLTSKPVRAQQSASLPTEVAKSGPTTSGTAPGSGDIIVTARKRSETLQSVPVSVTAFGEETLTSLKIDSFNDYATKVPNLSFAYGTGNLGFSNSRTVAIRGLAGTNTTGFYIDDTPVFDTMDPRVVDLERIEVLKGPQGTLFGSGSVGGTVRLVTRQPDLGVDSYRAAISGGHTSHASTADYGGEFMINKVVIPEKLAIRALAFYDHEGGFLKRSFPSAADPTVRETRNDQGALRTFGGSLSVKATPSEDFTINARVMFQDARRNGFTAAYAPLPGFAVQSLTLDRDQDLQEVAKDRWVLPSLELKYDGQGWSLVSSTSYFVRKVYDAEDSTEATKSIMAIFGYTAPAGPVPWTQNYLVKRFAQETRFTFDNFLSSNGVIGVFYSHTKADGGIPFVYAPGMAEQGVWFDDLLWDRVAGSKQTDLALFGEIYTHLTDKLTLTLGARLYKQTNSGFTDIQGFFSGAEGVTQQTFPKFTEKGISPKVALDYKISPDLMVYASASRGFRPGARGGQLPQVCTAQLAEIGYTPESASSYTSDKIWNYEAGVKASPAPGINASLAGFQIDWSDIQQSIYLDQCGFLFTANSGAARIRGTEFELSGRVASGLDVKLGIGYQDAIITDAGNAPRPVGSRILQVPKYTFTVSGIYRHRLSDRVEATFSADYSRTGNSMSANSSPSVPLVRPAYDITNIRVGFEFGESELSFYGKNIFNNRANLGDIQFIGFAEDTPRVAVLRPTQFGVQYRVQW